MKYIMYRLIWWKFIVTVCIKVAILLNHIVFHTLYFPGNEDCCRDRLKNFEIIGLLKNHNTKQSYQKSIYTDGEQKTLYNSSRIDLEISDANRRNLFSGIEILVRNDSLTLCEVQVFGGKL